MKNYEMTIEITLGLDFLSDLIERDLIEIENGKKREFDNTAGITFFEFLLLQQISQKVNRIECARIVANFHDEDDRINKDKIYRKIKDLITI